MGKYLPVQYDECDDFYVKSMGLEENAALAHRCGSGKPYCVLHFVLDGQGWLGGQTVCENQGFYIEKEAAFEYHSSVDKPWHYFWIIFSAPLAEKYVTKIFCPDENGIFSFSFRPSLLALCRRLFVQPSLGHEKALSVFFELLSYRRDTVCSVDGKPHGHVEQAKCYIERNINRPLPVSEVARAVHLDEQYLYKLFCRFESISPKAYIIQKKIELACGILCDTDMSVTEAARRIGFSDVCDFSKFFSKNTGLSPTAYRKQVSE